VEAVVVVEILAQNNFGDTRSGGLAGPTGLVIILLLVIGTILLIRNMNARLRRLPERFEPEKFEQPARRGATTVPPVPPDAADEAGPDDPESTQRPV
jgi:hypothetical protein